ncbi:DUF6585 family protein [Culicoidibacter larvae]|uniref:Uncharacterized protein n=1 Tax=Culicoidibacter larvae TaxID=2579976 RepID=A0A5R8QA31_9FIRM|nr:DUF6585 family protein [Culicoidibacter larvae]TLG72717.1 hypothetical protein FEZ08_08415 [Culicoidibacter larvae]
MAEDKKAADTKESVAKTESTAKETVENKESKKTSTSTKKTTKKTTTKKPAQKKATKSDATKKAKAPGKAATKKTKADEPEKVVDITEKTDEQVTDAKGVVTTTEAAETKPAAKEAVGTSAKAEVKESSAEQKQTTDEIEPSAVAVFFATTGKKAKELAATTSNKTKELAANAKNKYKQFQDERAAKKAAEAQTTGNTVEKPVTEAKAVTEAEKKKEDKTDKPVNEKVSLKKATAMEDTGMGKVDSKITLDEKDPIIVRSNYFLYAIRIVILVIVLYFVAIALSFFPQDLLAAAEEKMPSYYGLAMMAHNLVMFAIVLVIISQIVAMFNTIKVYKNHIVIKKYFFWERHFNIKEVQDIRWIKRVYYAGFLIPIRNYYEVVIINQDKKYHLLGMRYVGLQNALSAFDDAWLEYKMTRALNKIADNKQLSFADALTVTERGINCEGTLILWSEVARVEVVKSEVLVEVKNQNIIYRNFIDKVRDVSLLIMLADYFTA